jgi:hypothetical protein
MKAKLAHSVEIDQLTDKISDLVGSNIDPLKQITSLLTISYDLLKMEQDASVKHVYELLDRVRKRLAEVDEGLMESSSLLKGYIVNVLDPPQQAVVAPPALEPAIEEELYSEEEPEEEMIERRHEYKPKYKVPSHNKRNK